MLRQEVDAFVAIMGRKDEAERRRYQRVSGRGHRAGLEAPGQVRLDLPIRDISRGGMALASTWCASLGTELTVALPGAGVPVATRVMRSGGGMLALAFHQDPGTLARVDDVLAAIGRAASALAA